MNLDTGTAVNTLPLNFAPDGTGYGKFYKTVSGECILDGGVRQFQRYDGSGLSRSLNGRLTGAHVNSTPINTARTELHTQHDHNSSREHAWLKIAHLCVLKKIIVIPVSCLSYPCLLPLRSFH